MEEETDGRGVDPPVQQERDGLGIGPAHDHQREQREGRDREQEPRADPLGAEDLADEPALERLSRILCAHAAGTVRSTSSSYCSTARRRGGYTATRVACAIAGSRVHSAVY